MNMCLPCAAEVAREHPMLISWSLLDAGNHSVYIGDSKSFFICGCSVVLCNHTPDFPCYILRGTSKYEAHDYHSTQWPLLLLRREIPGILFRFFRSPSEEAPGAGASTARHNHAACTQPDQQPPCRCKPACGHTLRFSVRLYRTPRSSAIPEPSAETFHSFDSRKGPERAPLTPLTL